MKKTVIMFICAALLCMLVLPQSAQAGLLDGYEITAYDVKVVISADNVYDITETISVCFSEERHGIYRDIPVNSEMTRMTADGQSITTQVNSKVFDVSAEGWDYVVQDDGETVSIRIGNADRFVTGDQTYRISYKIQFGDDGVSSFDEVYYNIIGSAWDTQISNITFSVTLPKAFDTSSIGFSAGEYGTSGYDPAELVYTVQGNTVNGSMRHLGMFEGLTTRIELPEGYFNKTGELPDWMGKLGLSLLLYMLLGKIVT